MLSDNGVDQFGRSHVKGRVVHGATLRGNGVALAVGDFLSGTLLNRDLRAVNLAVEGAGRCGNHHFYPVMAGDNGQVVGADLIGNVTIGCHPVGADDHPAWAMLAHELRGRAFDGQGDGNIILHQLPAGQAGAL